MDFKDKYRKQWREANVTNKTVDVSVVNGWSLQVTHSERKCQMCSKMTGFFVQPPAVAAASHLIFLCSEECEATAHISGF